MFSFWRKDQPANVEVDEWEDSDLSETFDHIAAEMNDQRAAFLRTLATLLQKHPMVLMSEDGIDDQRLTVSIDGVPWTLSLPTQESARHLGSLMYLDLKKEAHVHASVFDTKSTELAMCTSGGGFDRLWFTLNHAMPLA